MISGIYKIVNLKNGKFYIGSAINLHNRKLAHFGRLRNNGHKNPHLQSSWNKYGKDSFEFSIIEECDIDSLLDKEQYYIDVLKPHYNIFKATRCTKEQLDKLREIAKKKDYTHQADRIRQYTVGSNNPMTKLTEDNVRDIKMAIKNNIPSKETQLKFNISVSVYHYIKSGKTWKHVKI